MSSSPSHGSRPASQFNDPKLAQARKLIVAGDIAAAREVNDALLAEHPDHCGGLIQRSRLESIDDHYRQARKYALAAYRAGVTEKWQCLLLLRQLRTFNLVAELRDLVAGLPQELALDADVAVLVARLFGTINDPQGALDATSRAAEVNPASADLQAAMGLALINLGRFDESEIHLQECLRLDEGHSSAWWHLSRLRKHDAGRNHVDELRQRIARAPDPRNAAILAFALHRELDDIGDYAGAISALDLACSSMRKTVAYDPMEDEQLFAALRSLPVAEGPAGVDAGSMPFTPVFIVGMHRSGTTLLEHLLAGHDEVCPGGELYDFTSQLRFAADHHSETELDLQIVEASRDFDYEEIGRGYLAAVEWRRAGQRFVTDKLPSNFLNIGFILRALPAAKILHMARDPMETCFSNLRQPFSERTCRYSYDQGELGAYYRQYFDLMQHWRRRFPGRIHDVTYTALATNPVAELKRICAYLGIEFNASMIDAEGRARAVNTASAVQVRNKPSLPLQPKWQPYREYLTPLAWRLSDVGQRY